MSDETLYDPTALFGWVDHPDRQAVAAEFPTLFGESPEFQGDADDTSDVLLYKAWKEVLGDYPNYPAQEIGDCFPAGTIVFGEQAKPIEDVRPGDRVWTGEGRLTTVVSTRSLSTLKPLVRVESVGGMPITCTADHRFLAYRLSRVHGKRVSASAYAKALIDGPAAYSAAVVATYEARTPEWVAAGELTADDCLLSPVAYEAAEVPQWAERWWASPVCRWVLGYFLGNGHASGGTAEFAYPGEVAGKRIAMALESLGYPAKDAPYREGCNARRVRVHSRPLVQNLRKAFYDADGAKRFPAWAIGDQDFLAGLIDADGTVSNDIRSLDTTSLSVAYGALASLTMLGQSPSINKAARSKGTYANAKPLWRVNWRPFRTKSHIWRDERFLCRPVRSVEFIEGPTTVYDIGVADAHHSFIANGHAVHNCTSFGCGHALDLLQCVEIQLGEPEEYKEICTEAIYGLGREIAGMLGGGDGCYGGAVAKAVTQFGAVPREAVGAYSGQRAKQWGGRGGVPKEIRDLCARNKLGAAVQVKGKAELDAALNSGYPVTIASNQGFTTARDANGICYPRGSWAHQMFIAGRAWIGGKLFYLICQSWGSQMPSGPRSNDQPPFSFFAPDATCYRILGADDSWAFSLWGGFKRRDLPPGWSYMGMS